MSRELSRLYRALVEETDGRALMAPEQLRRRADRRARNRAAVGALAVAALVAGTAAGAQLVRTSGPGTPPGPPAGTPTSARPTPDASSPVPSPTMTRATPSRTPGTSPSAGPPSSRTPTTIPDRAFFALAPANDAGIAAEFTPGPVLPELCGAEPGGSGIVQRRARVLAYKLTGTPAGYVPDGSYRHSITIYRAGRADDALRELRQAVRDCPLQQVPDAPGVRSTQRLLDDGGYGDESVLFEVRTPYRDVNGRPTGGDELRLVRAVRIGDVVTVLWEQGWENTSSIRSQVDADSRRAVEAIRRWWN
ncbi:hypothetical protein DKT69_09625 [Micromonospora sicca]|uniref:Uncharacterized protein n=2 Tax=Micromonospora TaxID=1873 RepID=A0A317DM35_9ACTN|nr:hypothetical protein [Micromonospora sp. 4G51]PWR15701.1 hypothetical protein DKT69_09625 [Micromonospora sp. 4G51]